MNLGVSTEHPRSSPEVVLLTMGAGGVLIFCKAHLGYRQDALVINFTFIFLVHNPVDLHVCVKPRLAHSCWS